METANNLLKNSSEAKIFEIKKLIEIVAQELAFLASITDENNSSVHYSLKLSKFHMGSVKKQKLASCSYPSCLFNIRQKLWKNSQQLNQKTHKKTTTSKSVKGKLNNKNVYRQKQNRHLSRLTFQRRVNATSNQSNQKIATLVQKVPPKYPKPKRLIETGTQTAPWTPESPPFSSSYQNSFRNISDNGEEEIFESEEEEFYCKSDTLNDASMITEEIASEFARSRSRVDYKEHTTSSKSKESVIMEENVSNRNYTSQSNNLGSDLKSEMITQYSLRESISASRDQKSVIKGRDTPNDQRSIRTQTSKSIYSVSKRVNSSSNKMTENEETVINLKSRSMSVLSVKSSRRDASVRSLSKASGSSKKSEQKSTAPSSKRSSISKKHSSNSRKLTSPKTVTSDVSDTQEPQDENENQKKTEAVIENLDTSKSHEEPENREIKEPPVEFQDEFLNELNQDSNISLKQEDASNQILDNSPPPPISSSDNETTYFPVVSNSSSASGCLEEDDSEGSSSIKENDNDSLEYSSHWTEEITSLEVSDAEMDESFNERFLMYKEGLLDEDDGIVASSEDETPSTEEQQVTEIQCNGEGVLHRPLTEVICDENMKNFLELVKNKENILQFVDENGWNLLHLAASRGLDDFIEELLHHGILIDSTTKDGYTALHLAILNNDLECCKVLLRNGASLFSGDEAFDNELLSKINTTATSPVKSLVEKYEENLRKVLKITKILNKFGSNKKNSSLVLPKNLLMTLADLTLDDEDQGTLTNDE
ncbi:ankyrin repeat domain-containing protein 31-like isoform X2 [Argiope bruennichi]|nr:ankyrin repeat domain-containing protein 31-like isoform X2 [Argiope bruennichi]XP_055947397.1 ankyrin repeat domain-containing protein 31-like isoform X2 [Argiope bruennichi]